MIERPSRYGFLPSIQSWLLLNFLDKSKLFWSCFGIYSADPRQVRWTTTRHFGSSSHVKSSGKRGIKLRFSSLSLSNLQHSGGIWITLQLPRADWRKSSQSYKRWVQLWSAASSAWNASKVRATWIQTQPLWKPKEDSLLCSISRSHTGRFQDAYSTTSPSAVTEPSYTTPFITNTQTIGTSKPKTFRQNQWEFFCGDASIDNTCNKPGEVTGRDELQNAWNIEPLYK